MLGANPPPCSVDGSRGGRFTLRQPLAWRTSRRYPAARFLIFVYRIAIECDVLLTSSRPLELRCRPEGRCESYMGDQNNCGLPNEGERCNKRANYRHF